MAKDIWYQKKSWTPEDEKDFFTHLQRAKSTYNKAQHLRIQAYYLQYECAPPNFEAALILLEHLITDFPDPNELGAAYLQKAKCYEALGKIKEALPIYRDAVKFSKNDKGTYNTDAPFHFAIFVAEYHCREYYNEALDNFKGSQIELTIFPHLQFKALASMAIMANDSGWKMKAKTKAREALEIAKTNQIQFEAQDKDIKNKLIQISEAKNRKWLQFWK